MPFSVDANMVLFIVLFTFLSASATSDGSKVFRKCCPKDQNLIKVIDYESQYNVESYKCVGNKPEISFKNISNPSSPLVVSASVPIEYGFPGECDIHNLQLSETKIQLSGNNDICFDRLVNEVNNGTVRQVIPKSVALLCKGTDLRPDKDMIVENIRKCCPSGQVYDIEYHLCRTTDNKDGEEWITDQLKTNGGDIYEFENGLYCKKDEYAVELTDDKFYMNVDGTTLNAIRISGYGGGRSLPGNWCLDQEYRSHRLIARVCTNDCEAYGAYCLRKCCPVGEYYLPKRCSSPISKCVPNTEDAVLYNISTYLDPLRAKYNIQDVIMGIRSDIVCKHGKIALNLSIEADQHWLTSEGMLHTSIGITEDYCIEVFDTRRCSDRVSVTAMTCFTKPLEIKDFRVSFVCNCISAVCLAITLVVYCSIRELRNLHGLTLICHVSTMLLAYSCLARVQYNKVSDQNLCKAFAYAIYIGFVAAFAWLNVMCFDIWWTFGNVRTVQSLHKGKAERRRFCWYSLYAWSVCLVLTLTLYLLDRFPVSKILDANMGHGRCWFGSDQNSKMDWPHYIFFVIPMGLVTGVNFVLWALTARHCARVKSEVHRLQAGSVGERAKKYFRVDKANMVLTGKLWVVMGAGWISELVSTVVSNQPHWTLTIMDMINELQGVFIFIILVFKPKLYYLIRKKLGLEKADGQKNGPSSSARTSSTFLSRTVSTDERANKRVCVPNDAAKIL